MEEIVQAIVIGVVQGLTEFLPISSSAHLILVPRILAGTTCSSTAPSSWSCSTWARSRRCCSTSGGTCWSSSRPAGRPFASGRWPATPSASWPSFIVITVIPAGILGSLFEGFIDTFFRDAILVIPFILVVGATILWLAEKLGTRDRDLTR